MKPLFRSVLGYYQLVGGAIGVVVSLFGLKQSDTTDTLVIGVVFVAMLIYAYSMLCGVVLLRASAHALALRLSAANQFVQVLVISSTSITYKFVSGLAIIVGVKSVPELTVGLKATLSTFLIHWGSANAELFYGLNLVALMLLVLIFQELKRG